MNVRWCTLSGWGCSGGGVSGDVGAATHDVCLCWAGLIASPAGRAGGAVVAIFDLVAV
jgi:hypothetical protein